MAANGNENENINLATAPPPSYVDAVTCPHTNPETVPLNQVSQEKADEAQVPPDSSPPGYYQLPIDDCYTPPTPCQPMLDNSNPANTTAQPHAVYSEGNQVVRIVEMRQAPGRTYNSYMCFSVLNCFCCCCILGIVAILYSFKTQEANKAGDMARARRLSRTALNLNIVSLIMGVVFAGSMYFLRATFATSYELYGSYTTTSRYYNIFYDLTTEKYYFG